MPRWQNDKLGEEEESMVLKTPCPKDAMTNEEKEGVEPMTTLRTETRYNNANIHLEKLALLSMSHRKTNNIVDIQKK
jgi:hypothetical protein